MRQCHEIGTRALPFILVSGLFIGFGMVAQALYWLDVFGGTWLFGGLLSIVLVREVAPVLVGLIVVGRSGSAIIVELGIMQAGGRVHMLDAQGIDPFLYLVVPRVLAVTICMFCLTVAFVAVAMLAGFFSADLIGISKYSFFVFMDRILTSIDTRTYFRFCGGIVVLQDSSVCHQPHCRAGYFTAWLCEISIGHFADIRSFDPIGLRKDLLNGDPAS
jgi:phospholipid/cholesterol/gamma-HCH transport system permease protein